MRSNLNQPILIPWLSRIHTRKDQSESMYECNSSPSRRIHYIKPNLVYIPTQCWDGRRPPISWWRTVKSIPVDLWRSNKSWCSHNEPLAYKNQPSKPCEYSCNSWDRCRSSVDRKSWSPFVQCLLTAYEHSPHRPVYDDSSSGYNTTWIDPIWALECKRYT